MAPHTIDINRENNKFNSTSNLINNTNSNNTNNYSDIHLPTNNSYQSTTLTTATTTLTTIGSTTTNEILFQQEQQSYYQQPINTEIFGGNYNNINNNQTQFDINLNSVYLPQATTTTQFLSNNSIDYSPYSTGNTTTPSPLTTTFENINYITGEEEEEEEDDYSSEFEEKNFDSIMINGTNTFNNKINKFNMSQYDDESCSQNQFADLFTQSQVNVNNNLIHENNYQQFDNYSSIKQEPMGYDDYNNYAHYQQQQYQQQQQQQMPLSHQQPQQQQQTTKSGKSNRKREEVKYGPIVVRPRVQAAPTLLTGRKSKYIQLTPDEERKREVRRCRNRAAAEKCKKKRMEIEDHLNKTLHTLKENQKSLTREFEQLTRQRNQLQTIVERVKSTCCATNTNNVYQQQQQQPQYQQPQMTYYNQPMYSTN